MRAALVTVTYVVVAFSILGSKANSIIEGTLPERIREHFSFDELLLKEIHRTSDPTLISLFQEGRGIVLKGTATGKAKLAQMRDFLVETNHGALGAYGEAVKSLPSDLANGIEYTEVSFDLAGLDSEAAGRTGVGPQRRRAHVAGDRSG